MMTDTNIDERIRSVIHQFGTWQSRADAQPRKLEEDIKQLITESQLEILRGFRRQDFVSGDFYETAVLERLAAPQGQPEE